MVDHGATLSAPERLVLVYASPDLRGALGLLLTFDHKLADIVGRAGEPMIAQMKIAWWYDAIGRDEAARPRGEPLLQALSEIEQPALEGSMKELLDAWGELLTVDEWTSDVLDSFAKNRSAGIFESYARWVGSDDDVSQVGKTWALADLKQRFGSRVPALLQPPEFTRRLGRKLRPLSILSLSVTRPSGPRMMWHALTGR